MQTNKDLITWILEWLQFDICNNDWEHSDKDYERVVDEIYNAMLDEEEEDPREYILEYLKKNYPFNIKNERNK